MPLDIPNKDLFSKPAWASEGDADTDTINLARGRLLGAWEVTERGFALIFSKLVAPAGSGYAAQRAYGTIIAAYTRQLLISTAAEVFFRNFPDSEVEAALPKILALYLNASARRNEVAHGIIGNDVMDGNTVHFLMPNTWTSKSRRVDLSIDYRYSSAQMDTIQHRFMELSCVTDQLYHRLEDAFWSAPEKVRKRY